MVAAASPYLAVAGLVAMILFVGARQWVLTILAAVLCLVMVGIQLPRYIGPEKATVPGVAVRVVTANLGLGEADPLPVVALARESADVLVLQEMTPAVAKRCRRPAWTPCFRTGSSTPAACGGRRGVEPISDRGVRPHHRLRDADAEGPDHGSPACGSIRPWSRCTSPRRGYSRCATSTRTSRPSRPRCASCPVTRLRCGDRRRGPERHLRHAALPQTARRRLPRRRRAGGRRLVAYLPEQALAQADDRHRPCSPVQLRGHVRAHGFRTGVRSPRSGHHHRPTGGPDRAADGCLRL